MALTGLRLAGPYNYVVPEGLASDFYISQTRSTLTGQLGKLWPG